MGRPPKLPQGQQLVLLRASHSTRELADMFGVGQGAVNEALRRARGRSSTSIIGHLPAGWRPYNPGHLMDSNYFYRVLAAYVRRQQGMDERPEVSGMLDQFLQVLKERDLVVLYDRDTPTGWLFRSRRPEDGDSLLVPR